MLKVTKKADYKIYTHITKHIMKSIVLLRFRLKKTKLKKTIQYILKYCTRNNFLCIHTFFFLNKKLLL